MPGEGRAFHAARILGDTAQNLETLHLLGKVGAWVVGPQLLQADTIFVPPSFLAGWAGLVTAALNALPLGSSDGGRACTVRWQLELPGLKWACTASCNTIDFQFTTKN